MCLTRFSSIRWLALLLISLTSFIYLFLFFISYLQEWFDLVLLLMLARWSVAPILILFLDFDEDCKIKKLIKNFQYLGQS